ncbi:MAG: FAD-dependent oxidoreductase [Labilithrix sp.]|nr:FAD-dependent oxidoreductase [Labilithrix sp.]MCW5817844.1 FAD-dependent oxidoreductase [Labilithrix sp.]
MPPPPTFDLRLATSRMLTVNVRELDFERVDGAPFEFQAGQWISLVLPLPDGEGRRAYSIASPPNGTSRLSLAVTKVEGGPGSTFLHELSPGAIVRAIGPQGFFTRDRGLPSLFVGTGTGVTPLRSMILDAVAKGDDAPMTLLFGVRTPEDRLYADELDALAASRPSFQVHYSLSRAGDDWTGRRGYVQTHVEELYRALGAPNAHVWICGLERMVGAVRDLLRKQMGVERKQVHTERYD